MILETERLVLREAGLDDAAFVLDLLNAPGFLQGIGDRGVRNLDQARDYIETRIIGSYRDHGFGMWVVAPKDAHEPAGLAGLVKREVLPHVDLGYAFLERSWGQGYAQEAAMAVLDHARGRLGLATVAAIVNPDNWASRRVLEKIGFTFIDVRHLDGWEQPSAYYCA
ncbi:GNAT family N-acetyltransferase [Phenylobacterium sp.]|uniref:GNAT family N-acetyltransferase n=1 Tax=Phenylobacterium sp. TaxID=1871053 RepID=UPI00262D6552|nr:GNAT family N-acetyltransferase [Phenylobacterium sp.]